MRDTLLLKRRERARVVLAQMAIVSEGSSTAWDTTGHGQAESREPVRPEVIDQATEQQRDGDCPPESRSLYDHWLCRFARAWDDAERLLYWILLAEERLAAVRKTRPPAYELPSGSKLTDLIVTTRGSPAEVAARFARHGVTMAHVRKVRLVQRRDPETGDPWLWPDESTATMMTPEARQRAKAYAQEVARDLLGTGLSQRRVSEATGIPRATLQRMLSN